jgi:hypothetical protein
MAPMIWFRRIGIVLACAAVLVALAWVFRASIAETLIGAYFKEQGIASDVTVDRLEWSGLAGHFALGDAKAPDLSADTVDMIFDNSRWLPQVVALRVVHPVVRARVDANGTITLPALQSWIDKLTSGASGHSRFVSDDLVIDLQNLRAIVATPGGPLDLRGNAQLKRDALVFADIAAQPAVLSRGKDVLRVDGARLSARASAAGLSVTANFAGSLNGNGMQAAGINASLSASGVRWAGGKASADNATLQIAARDLRSGAAHLIVPSARIALTNVRTASSGGRWNAQAKVQAQATAQTTPSETRPLFAQISGQDPALDDAVAKAAQALRLNFAADMQAGSGGFGVRLTAPATLAGNNRATLRIDTLALEDTPQALQGAMDGEVSGNELPSIALSLRHFAWTPSSFDADAAINAHFDYGMLRDADVSVTAHASRQNGRFTLALAQCARTRIGMVRAGRTTMARRVAGTICANANTPLIASDANGWTAAGLAKNLVAEIPRAAAKLSGAGGTFLFQGHGGAPVGKVRIAHARIADMTRSPRFRPLGGGANIALANNRVTGEATVTGKHNARVGRVTFTHDLNSGAGKADIAARDVHFDPKGLQPADLSPLLAQIRNAQGRANFTGAVAWTRRGTTSHGVLDIAELNFASPLGPAHALQSSIAFKSLLPLVTVDGQKLDIAKIDWTLPFTDTHAVFAMTPGALRLDSAKTDVAGGTASLDGLTVALNGKAAIQDTARLDNIDLAQIVSATNIGSKVKVVGRVTGVLPFTSSAEGFRIAKGHIESVGPGRLSIDPTLWTKGDATVNGVQDFAYQALENLAVDSMTADIDSVDNGRLRIVFHIKGHSDPPKPQEARVGLFDLLRGTAFDKPVPLPSGTPIDLTLETSLNFDELLKSYQAAWSQTLATTPTSGE